MAGRPKTKDEANADDEMEISELLKSLGDSSILVKLYKYDARNKAQFLEELPLETIQTNSLEAVIRDIYGGGSYLVRVVKDGLWLKGANKVVHIAGSPQGTDVQQSAPAESSAVEMMRMQMQMSRDSSDQMMALMQQSTNQMMTLMTTIMAGNKPLDPIALATLLSTNRGGGAESLSMVKEVFALAKEIGPGGGAEPDPMMGLITAALPQLLGSGNGGARPQQQLPPATPPKPGTVAVPAPNPPQPAERTEVDERIQFLNKLKAKARAGQDVNDWADYIENNQDEAACQWILAAVNAYPWDQVWAGLMKVDPELAVVPLPDWFGRLYAALREGPGEEETNESGKVHSEK